MTRLLERRSAVAQPRSTIIDERIAGEVWVRASAGALPDSLLLRNYLSRTRVEEGRAQNNRTAGQAGEVVATIGGAGIVAVWAATFSLEDSTALTSRA